MGEERTPLVIMEFEDMNAIDQALRMVFSISSEL